MTPSEDPTEHLAAAFAREVAAIVERGRVDGAFERLALVAAPRFLGRLRRAFSEPCRAMIVASVDKNLADATPETVRAVIAEQTLV